MKRKTKLLRRITILKELIVNENSFSLFKGRRGPRRETIQDVTQIWAAEVIKKLRGTHETEKVSPSEDYDDVRPVKK